MRDWNSLALVPNLASHPAHKACASTHVHDCLLPPCSASWYFFLALGMNEEELKSNKRRSHRLHP